MKKRRFANLLCGIVAACVAMLPLATASAADQAMIVEALSAAAARGGGVALLPAGTYHLKEPIVIPDGVELRGQSEASVRLVAPQDATFPAIVLRHVRNAGVSRLQLLEENHRYQAKAPAIAVEGESVGISVREVSTHGFSSGFCIGREEAGTVRNLVMESCRAEASRLFGFEINHASGIALENCYSFRHRLDGIKLRKQTRDVTITGGDSSRNGWFDPKLNGNGIDAFAGGDNWVVRDLVNEENNGSGIYLKTGPLQYTGYGTVENAQIFNVRSRRNRGSGIDINRSGGDLPRDGRISPMLSHVIVVGGISEGNRSSGYYVRGRKVALLAPLALANGWHGIDLASAWDVTVIAPTVLLGAPSEEGGSRYGLQTGFDPVKGEAHRVAMLEGRVGALPLPEGAVAAPLAAWHVSAGSRHVLINRLAAPLVGAAPSRVAPEAAATTRVLSDFAPPTSP